MQITEIIEILRNRLNTINNGKAQAKEVGDLDSVLKLETEAEQTKLTLTQLETVKAMQTPK